jgi:hypothetical protein
LILRERGFDKSEGVVDAKYCVILAFVEIVVHEIIEGHLRLQNGSAQFGDAKAKLTKYVALCDWVHFRRAIRVFDNGSAANLGFSEKRTATLALRLWIV